MYLETKKIKDKYGVERTVTYAYVRINDKPICVGFLDQYRRLRLYISNK